jgi:hypothetical protein
MEAAWREYLGEFNAEVEQAVNSSTFNLHLPGQISRPPVSAGAVALSNLLQRTFFLTLRVQDLEEKISYLETRPVNGSDVSL